MFNYLCIKGYFIQFFFDEPKFFKRSALIFLTKKCSSKRDKNLVYSILAFKII